MKVEAVKFALVIELFTWSEFVSTLPVRRLPIVFTIAAELNLNCVIPSPEKVERTVSVFVLIPFVADSDCVLTTGV